MKLFRGFKESLTLETPFPVERLFGGALLGARGANFVVFYAWESGEVVRKIDVAATVAPREDCQLARVLERGRRARGAGHRGRGFHPLGAAGGAGRGFRAGGGAGGRGGERVLGGRVLRVHDGARAEVLRGRRGAGGAALPGAQGAARVSRARQRRRPRRQGRPFFPLFPLCR